MGLHDFTLYDVICRNAQLYHDRPAWLEVSQSSPITFGQIKQDVDGLAAALQRAGCQKGDRIGVLGKNSLAYFVLYGAAAALGAIVLPVNWRLSGKEAAFVLNDGKPRWVFADNSLADWIADVRTEISDSVRFFNLQPNRGPFDEIPTDVDPSGWIPAQVDADDGFVIIHTAAVSGDPRGALLSQRNLLYAHLHLGHCLGLTAQDVHMNALPLFHVAGLFMCFCAFHMGCLTINLPKFDPARMIEYVETHQVSFMFTFAPMLKNLLDAQSQSKSNLSSLRAVMGLDAPDVIERFQEVTQGTFYCMYGQTETSMLASMGPYRDAPGSAGYPLLLANLQLLDDRDQPVAPGQVGEIAMRGPMVFKGYWGLEEDTQYTFRNGWHHTGDLGRLDDAGILWYAGRKADKELIKPGGENVYPAEVEKAILAHPAIEEVVVLGVPDPKWKEGIKAVCRLSEGSHLTPQTLIDFVGERIARYKKPQYVEFVRALPKKADGTIDREAVKQKYGGI